MYRQQNCYWSFFKPYKNGKILLISRIWFCSLVSKDIWGYLSKELFYDSCIVYFIHVILCQKMTNSISSTPFYPLSGISGPISLHTPGYRMVKLFISIGTFSQIWIRSAFVDSSFINIQLFEESVGKLFWEIWKMAYAAVDNPTIITVSTALFKIIKIFVRRGAPGHNIIRWRENCLPPRAAK